MTKKTDDSDDHKDIHNKIKNIFAVPGGIGIDLNAAAMNNPQFTNPDGEEEKDAENHIDEILERVRNFSYKPKEIRDYLDRFVISQDEAKKVLSVAICDHYNHVRQCIKDSRIRERDYAKPNVILLGPTGVGKTYLVRTISKLIGVPFVKADATKFSETGYVGRDVEELVRDLVKNADNNVDLAEYGIIYIDEIDKLARKAGKNGGMDVSGRGVQINLLKLMEDTEVSLTSQNDIAGQMESMMAMMNGGSGPKRKKSISTKHILFIVSGAFDKLDENIRERLVGSEIGFGRTPSGVDQDTSDFLKKVETRDLVEYGLEPEFVGRIPVRVICEKLSAGHLYEILKNSEGSVLKQYQSEFKGYDIDMSISEDALQDIAARAAGELTGARGLVTILEKIFRNFKFELPSTNIKELEVSAKTISDPEGSLSEILDTYKEELPEQLLKEIQEFADRFERENQIKLKFTDKAMQLLSKESTETDKTIRSICEQKFHDYQYGLTLIARNSEQNTFLLDENAIENPDEVLSKWIVEHYRKEGAAE